MIYENITGRYLISLEPLEDDVTVKLQHSDGSQNYLLSVLVGKKKSFIVETDNETKIIFQGLTNYDQHQITPVSTNFDVIK